MIKDKDILTISNLYKSLKIAYKKKRNIQIFLNKKKISNPKKIQLSYDLQSGSYIKKLIKLKKIDKKVFNFFNKTLTDNFRNINSILDFGTGELTRFMYVIDYLKRKSKIKYFACDLSLNRLFLGKNFYNSKILKNKIDLETFTIDNMRIPLPDNSIDVVITCHAIESNRKSMKSIIKELYRICKKNALIIIKVPHPRHEDFLSDPTHVRPITVLGLSLFDQKLNKEWQKIGAANTPLGLIHDVNFNVENYEYVLDGDIMSKRNLDKLNDEELQKMMLYNNNVIKQININLRVIK